KAEDGKVAIRNIRRKAKESIESQVKDGDLGEDEGDRLLKELDQTTKKYADSVDALLAAKEKEILEV
ncbi:MAG: ribosome recycling factor, partial [Bifidobacteriaceae bacterium]|nr:ribosome recycling factor [Bifidobacteriaceae bacterium]